MMYLDKTVPSTIHGHMRFRSSPSPSLHVAAHLAVIFIELAVGEVMDDDDSDD